MRATPNPVSFIAAPQAQAAARYARLALGTPYVWGGTNFEKGVDCSGLCYRAYQMAGVPIPRTSQEQFAIGTPVARGTEIPGDLIFSYNNEGGVAGPGHVVMSLGGGSVIAADHTGTVVHIEPASTFNSVYVGSRRVVPATGQAVGSSSPGGSSSGGGGLSSDLGALTNPHTYFRIGEVLLGVILVFIGFIRLTHISVPIPV